MTLFLRPTARTVTFVAVASLGLAACGAQTQLPDQRVIGAGSAVMDTKSLTISIGLDLDDASRTAVADLIAADGEGTDSPPIDPAALESLLDARMVTTMATTDGSLLSDVDMTPTDPGKMPENYAVSASFVVGGESLFELRQVADQLYSRVDVPTIETMLATPGLTDDLRSMTSQVPDLSAAAEALLSGGWVGVDAEELASSMLEMNGTVNPSEAPTPEPSAVQSAAQDFFKDIETVLTRELEVVETGPDAYEVTAPLDRIVAGLSPSFVTFLEQAMGPMTTMPLGDLESTLGDAESAMAGKKATVDVTLDGDRLATVRMDVAQLADEKTRKAMVADGVSGIPVLVELVEDGDVPVPTDVTQLDIAPLLQQLMGGVTGMDADGDPLAGMSAKDLGMTEEEFAELMAEMESAS